MSAKTSEKMAKLTNEGSQGWGSNVRGKALFDSWGAPHLRYFNPAINLPQAFG